MARPQSDNSRPGILRRLKVGESHTDTVTVKSLSELSAAKKNIHHIWSSPCQRTRGLFSRNVEAVLAGSDITITLTITRTA